MVASKNPSLHFRKKRKTTALLRKLFSLNLLSQVSFGFLEVPSYLFIHAVKQFVFSTFRYIRINVAFDSCTKLNTQI